VIIHFAVCAESESTKKSQNVFITFFFEPKFAECGKKHVDHQGSCKLRQICQVILLASTGNLKGQTNSQLGKPGATGTHKTGGLTTQKEFFFLESEVQRQRTTGQVL
jgi:hypothetical protein